MYFTGLAVVSLPKASSEVRNIGGTQLPDFGPASRRRRLANHRQRTVIADALGCADVFVAIRQHRLDRFPECRTSATVLHCEPVDSTRQELLETELQFLQQPDEEPLAVNLLSCLLSNGCRDVSEPARKTRSFSIDIDADADYLKWPGTYRSAAFAQNAPDFSIAYEEIVRPFEAELAAPADSMAPAVPNAVISGSQESH